MTEKRQNGGSRRGPDEEGEGVSVGVLWSL